MPRVYFVTAETESEATHEVAIKQFSPDVFDESEREKAEKRAEEHRQIGYTETAVWEVTVAARKVS